MKYALIGVIAAIVLIAAWAYDRYGSSLPSSSAVAVERQEPAASKPAAPSDPYMNYNAPSRQ